MSCERDRVSICQYLYSNYCEITRAVNIDIKGNGGVRLSGLRTLCDTQAESFQEVLASWRLMPRREAPQALAWSKFAVFLSYLLINIR